MARRVLSILCYVVAGLFLATEGVLAFLDDQGTDKAGALLLSSAFAAVPLGVGLALSPGRRIREAGMVLMAGSGWVVLSALNFLYLSAREDMRSNLPAELFGMFDSYAVGGINFAVMAGLGIFLFLRGRQAVRS
ncbi:MAG TPA: hypothetical protein VIT45_18475 [Allosphingosinicella sp.]